MTTHPRTSRRKMARPSRTGRRAWWSALGGALRFVGRILRGLIAAAVLLAFVVGLPWALWHYIGWPLPDHVPTWAEVETVLLGPMTTTFLLDFLACLCWLVWAAFVLDVVRCVAQAARDGVHAARWPRISARRPVHALAAVLISAILLSILGSRATSPSTNPLSTPTVTGPTVVATAPAWPTTPDVSTMAVQHAALVNQQEDSAGPVIPQRPQSVVVRARDPETGTYDSLSRIAERTLGTHARWPEIFELNKGKPQPNGKPFTNPHLIFPGEELRLPADAKAAPVTPPEPPPQQPPPEQSTPAPTTAPPSTTATPPSTSVPSTQPTADDQEPRTVSDEPVISWGPELFVGLGLAAAVSAALLVARRRHRRGYQPGSGRRDDLDLPVAPVVYQLQLAHLRAEQGNDVDLEDTDVREDDRRVQPSPTVVAGANVSETGSTVSITPRLGVRDGREIALDLAVARGLGLIGVGAPAAARALLVTALASATTPADHLAMSAGTSVLVPADDLPLLLGHGTSRAHLPRSLRVFARLDEALDQLEADILRRAREEDSGPWPVAVLVARPRQHKQQRLQAVLDNGAPFGIVGVLLGQWQAGITVYVREAGTVSATGPGLGEALRGTQMFRVGADDATELLDLLRRAQPETPSLDAMVGSHVPGPRAAAMPRADKDTTVRDPAPDGIGGDGGLVTSDVVLAADTELEVTAVASPVDRSGTGLEITETRIGPPPGARLRAAAITTQPPTSTSSDIHDHEAAATDEAHSIEAAQPDDTTTAAGVDRAADRIRLTVLGQPRVHWRPQSDNTEADVTGAFQPRLRELLVFLGLHPNGATRESLIGALWADSPPEKTTSALNTALSRLRGAFSKATDGALTDIIAGDGSYRLDPSVVDVDYWQFDHAVTRRRAATTPHERIDTYRDIVNSYTGPLADGMSTDWIESAREAIRRDALDAVAALARALVDDDPEQTLDLLEMARAFDPHNELLYRDIMRLQERLGRLDAIPRTLTLLTTRLAEVDDRPTPQAIDLAARLRQRHETTPAAAGRLRGGERDRRGRGRSAAS